MSLKKIAEAVGVSPSTVSRILSGKNPKCASEEVQQKVWQAALDMNYRANPHARSLKSGESQEEQAFKLSVLYSRERDAYSNQFFQTLIQTVNETTLRRGHQIVQHGLTEEFLESRYKLEPHEGIVILGRCSKNTLRSLSNRTSKLVCVGLNPYEPGYDQIVCNGRVAAEMAMEYLLEKGHIRIGYVGECENEVRYLGYRNVLIREGIPFASSLVYPTQQTEEGGEHAAKKLLETPDPPSALFCANDATAIGVLAGLRALAPDLPRPAMISIDNIYKAQEVDHQLTTINIPVREMGAMAVTLLVDRMMKQHTIPVKVEFPCNLVRRKSS